MCIVVGAAPSTIILPYGLRFRVSAVSSFLSGESYIHHYASNLQTTSRFSCGPDPSNEASQSEYGTHSITNYTHAYETAI